MRIRQGNRYWPFTHRHTQDEHLFSSFSSPFFFSLSLSLWFASQVERLGDDGVWATAYTDGDFCTKFIYQRVGLRDRHEATATVQWAVPSDAAPGTYRLTYAGDSTGRFGGGTTAFTGTSGAFAVTAPE